MNDRSRRILFVQRAPGGGSMTGLLDLMRTLDRKRYEPVVLFYGDSPYAEEVRGVGGQVVVLGEEEPKTRSGGSRDAADGRRQRPGRRVRDAWSFMRSELPRARRIAAVIRRERIDLVYNNNNPRANRASIFAARLARVPQVCHVRFLGAYSPFIDRWLTGYVSYFIYMSVAIERNYLDDIGRPETAGKVIPDPFDLDGLAGLADRRTQIRAELGVGEQTTMITNVGRLVPWKGQDVFIRALGMTLKHYPGVIGIIVGGEGKSVADREYATGLRQLAKDLAIEGKVVFTGFRADGPALMAASDVVVHSATRAEPFGRVVVESMAAGSPVIATAAGGPLEILVDGETGLLVPPGDAGSMASAILRLLDSPAEASRIGANALAEAAATYDPRRFGLALADVLERALQR